MSCTWICCCSPSTTHFKARTSLITTCAAGSGPLSENAVHFSPPTTLERRFTDTPSRVEARLLSTIGAGARDGCRPGSDHPASPDPGSGGCGLLLSAADRQVLAEAEGDVVGVDFVGG